MAIDFGIGPTAAELEEKFEVCKPFADEPPEVTLGRLNWAVTQQTARFILFLDSLGLSREMILRIMDGVEDLQYGMVELVQKGLQIDEGNCPPEVHPSEVIFEELIDEVTDPEIGGNPLTDEEIEESTLAHRSILNAIEGGSDEMVIHGLQSLIEKWSATAGES